MEQLYNALVRLFPLDIANILLLYSGNGLIIQLQNYFPKLLKHITIYAKELEIINTDNNCYITKLNCSYCNLIHNFTEIVY